MAQKTKKWTGRVLLIIVLLSIGAYAFNYLRTTYLEKYLKEVLARRVSEGTDGFYQLTFNDLTISLLNGELRLTGVSLTPDTTVFKEWQKRDTLPDTYLKLHIGLIHFKGVNLTWRRDFKKLHFKSFEIKSPEVTVYSDVSTNRPQQHHSHRPKNLYQLISPYINVLSSNIIDVANASAKMISTDNDGVEVTYALKNVTFYAFNFLLDKAATQNSKLLYCDNFYFVTNQPQRLIANNEFNLGIDSLRLDTRDSLIYVSNIALTPMPIDSGGVVPNSLVTGDIRAITVDGIAFQRSSSLNYLDAKSFVLHDTHLNIVHYNAVSTDKTPPKQARNSTPNIVKGLSLYDLISPLLVQLSIDRIGVQGAEVVFTDYINNVPNRYKMGDLQFQADQLLINAQTDSVHTPWYAKSFTLVASKLQGEMLSANQNLSVDRFSLDSEKEELIIDGVVLRPIQTKWHRDYFIGSLKQLKLGGLLYNNGVRISSILVDSPNLEYVMPKGTRQKLRRKSSATTDHNLSVNAFNPYFEYLNVADVNLHHANFKMYEISQTDSVILNLTDFNFFATGFKADEQTLHQRLLPFDYQTMGFSFKSFSGELLKQNYIFTVNDGACSIDKGNLILRDIRLASVATGADSLSSTLSVTCPELSITDPRWLNDLTTNQLTIAGLQLINVGVQAIKPNSDSLSLTLPQLELSDLSWNNTHFSLGLLQFSRPDLVVKQRLKATDATTTYAKKRFKLPIDTALPQSFYSILAKDIADTIEIGHIAVDTAQIDYTAYKDSTIIHHHLADTDFSLGGIWIDALAQQYRWSGITFATNDITIPLKGDLYDIKIAHICLDNDNLLLRGFQYVSPLDKMKFAQLTKKSYYDLDIDSIWIKGIDYNELLQSRIKIDAIDAKNVELVNFIDQRYHIKKHKYYPMLWEYMQKAPFTFDIAQLNVADFTMIYEDISKKGTEIGRFYLTDMNGVISNVTNIVTAEHPYMVLNATGKFMDEANFTGKWLIPIDSLNKHFHLEAEMKELDITRMNEMVMPLAPVKIASGKLHEFSFSTDATPDSANIDMLMRYDSLYVELLHHRHGELVEDKFVSHLINKVIKDKNEKPATAHVVRDPFHPMFNYIWQILSPALIESVGISEREQEEAKKMISFFTKIRYFFNPKKRRAAEAIKAEELKSEKSLIGN